MIGDLSMEEVRPRHLRDLIRHLRSSTKLAPRSVRHIYGALHVMFRERRRRRAHRCEPMCSEAY